MNATKTAYEIGLEDGAEAYRSSGSTADPVNGWDGDLLNAVGLREVCGLFGLEYDVERRGTTDRLMFALEEYTRGCRIGCEQQSAE